MADRVVACHQPNFLPWLGYFAKMARSDVFILLDDVQFTRGANKHNWTTRVRIDGTNGPLWLSLPVLRTNAGLQRIADLRTDGHDPRWLVKMIRTLEQSYGRAPHAAEVLPAVVGILKAHSGSICETNIALIELLAGLLALDTRRVRSSSTPVEGTANQRLINLTRAQGGSVYLSGDGADDYQVEEAFRESGIALRKLGFRHPEYPQRPRHPFVAGLSVIDALCRIGVERTRSMLSPIGTVTHA